MFIYKENVREIIITTGTAIACCGIAALSILVAFHGKQYDIIVSIVCILIPLAILRGIKLGYILARFFYGALATMLAWGAINPYDDMMPSNISYGSNVVEGIISVAFVVFLFDCLGRHARLRELK